METDALFRYKTPVAQKLLAYGFLAVGDAFEATIPLLEQAFILRVTVTVLGEVRFRVSEAATGEGYVLVHVDSAQGTFVNAVRAACEAALSDIAQHCFDTVVFQAEQAQRMVAFCRDTWAISPEFLWKATPDNAILRRSDNQKWFAVLMIVERVRIGFSGSGTITVLDLKGLPSDIANRQDNRRYFPAYHMNKTHWFTVCLDGTLADEELFSRISESFALAR